MIKKSKTTKITKKKKLDELIRFGSRMSNLCFNLGQEAHPLNLPIEYKKTMNELREGWDKAYMDYIGPVKPLKGKPKCK
jgi:hypothetical protein